MSRCTCTRDPRSTESCRAHRYAPTDEQSVLARRIELAEAAVGRAATLDDVSEQPSVTRSERDDVLASVERRARESAMATGWDTVPEPEIVGVAAPRGRMPT